LDDEEGRNGRRSRKKKKKKKKNPESESEPQKAGLLRKSERFETK
jgi:hypothetical protein